MYAHSGQGRPTHDWHVLDDHLRAVADLAEAFAQAACLPASWARIAGMLHDVGKYSQAFQERLQMLAATDQPAHLENATPHHVDHSTAGAQFAVQALGHAGKLIAYAVAGHHAGLLNAFATNGPSLRARLQAVVEDWSACPKHLLSFDTLPPPPIKPTSPRVGFQLAFFTRFLFSCLVDADFLDTEAFLNPQEAAQRTPPASLDVLRQRLHAHLQGLPSHTPLATARADILNHCLNAAPRPPGFFSLTVPTGGGKTLSSLAFALDHALHHHLRRIIYVIPYTSIIEQNANVFRQALGDDVVLEHHSNFDPQKETPWSRLAAQNWDAPLVVTTNVQFFESLFANKPAACRKLHNIARSVVILDEAQMLPPHVLRPCVEALRELVRTYGCTVVLCTATQPALSSSPEFPDGIDNVTEIIPNPTALYEQFKRVHVTHLGHLDDAALRARLKQHEHVLCIVNTRAHARQLAELIPDAIHLSALMCPAHRAQVLAAIRQRLNNQHPCCVITTPLIEAGVDIDFPVVYRTLAGIDSLAQAAGRCNREARLPTGHLFIFEPNAAPPPGHLLQAIQEARLVLRNHSHPLSLEAVHDFFRAFFWIKGDQLDKNKILSKLEAGRQGDIPFRCVAERFKLIDDQMQPVIIPYDQHAKNLIAAARVATSLSGFARNLQRYTVQIYPQEWKALLAAGALEVIRDYFPVLTWTQLYDERFGLHPLANYNPSPDALVT